MKLLRKTTRRSSSLSCGHYSRRTETQAYGSRELTTLLSDFYLVRMREETLYPAIPAPIWKNGHRRVSCGIHENNEEEATFELTPVPRRPALDHRSRQGEFVGAESRLLAGFSVVARARPAGARRTRRLAWNNCCGNERSLTRSRGIDNDELSRLDPLSIRERYGLIEDGKQAVI